MALIFSTTYSGRSNAPTTAYPYGSHKNRTTSSSNDGSYYEQGWANDILGFHSQLLSSAGITPSGSPDQVGASDYYNALTTIFAKLASPALTGIPTAPTAAVGTNTTQIATMAALINTLGSGSITDSSSWNFSFPTVIGGVVKKIIFQGGTLSNSGSGARTLSVSFPVAFPTAVLDMHANDIGGAAYSFGTGWSSTSSGTIYVPAYSVGTSSTPAATSSLTCRWFAIGY